MSASGSVPPDPYPATPVHPYDGPLPTRRAPENGLGTAALVVGIVAILLFCTGIGGFVVGLVAVGLGIAGLSRVRRGVADNHNVAVVGIALGGFGAILSATIIAFAAFLIGSAGFGDLVSCVSDAKNNQAKTAQCQNDFQQRVNQVLLPPKT